MGTMPAIMTGANMCSGMQPQLLELQAAASFQSMPRLEAAISAADDWLSFAHGLIRTLFEPQVQLCILVQAA